MQWHAITKSNYLDNTSTGFQAPDMGCLPVKQTKVLIEILRKYTSTPGNCCFAIWDGWGLPALDKLGSGAACFHLPDRSYYLTQGPIDAAVQSISPLSHQGPSIWWPQDRSWCVATEVDVMWTYIGGKSECIDEILSDNRLETWRAALDDRADIHGDLLNR